MIFIERRHEFKGRVEMRRPVRRAMSGPERRKPKGRKDPRLDPVSRTAPPHRAVTVVRVELYGRLRAGYLDERLVRFNGDALGRPATGKGQGAAVVRRRIKKAKFAPKPLD